MDVSVGPSKQEYRAERAQRGRLSLVLSTLALVVSAWTLFETSLRWPTFDTYAGANWRYGRGTPVDVEVFVVPLTITNSGARPGAVLSIEMIVTARTGQQRRFSSAAVLQNDKDQRLFAPQTIQGQSAFAGPVVFVSAPARPDSATRPVIEANGIYNARITACTTYRRSLVIDDLVANPPHEVEAEVEITGFSLDMLASRPWTENRLEVSAKTAAVAPAQGEAGACSYRTLR
jgi:hypothetical protein